MRGETVMMRLQRKPNADGSLWAVEAWRGVAALMVVSAHWAPLLGGHNTFTAFAFTGVDVFFVISGFVFAPHILGRLSMPLAPYAVRRVLRIYPAYLVALGLYMAWKWQQGAPLLYGLEHLLMLHVQSREMAFYYSPPFWSLPAEVAFYACVPVLAWLNRAAFDRGWCAGLWLGVGAAALGLRVAMALAADAATQNLPYLVVHHLPGLLVEFLLGIWAWHRVDLVQAASPRERGQPAWWLSGMMLFVAALVAYTALEDGRGHRWLHGQLSLVAALGFALILVGTARVCPRWMWLQETGAWVGRLSYGVYLLHPLAGVGLVGAVAAWGLGPGLTAAGAGLVASAWAMHLAVEEPARRWGRGWSARRTAQQATIRA